MLCEARLFDQALPRALETPLFSDRIPRKVPISVALSLRMSRDDVGFLACPSLNIIAHDEFSGRLWRSLAVIAGMGEDHLSHFAHGSQISLGSLNLSAARQSLMPIARITQARVPGTAPKSVQHQPAVRSRPSAGPVCRSPLHHPVQWPPQSRPRARPQIRHATPRQRGQLVTVIQCHRTFEDARRSLAACDGAWSPSVQHSAEVMR